MDLMSGQVFKSIYLESSNCANKHEPLVSVLLKEQLKDKDDETAETESNKSQIW